ncbi:molybdopterin molybdotransferase MoeA [Halomonas sp. Bachu 37]|uniref:molybdopterin molybdotransferase MoeA n=1 Tax=Halomonas kashgarensis TaxID=3084920 RepID=UPI0032175B81
MQHICDQTARGMLDIFEARRRMTAAARALQEFEIVPLEAALGRVLGEAVSAEHDSPGVDNSAMDGYALRLADMTPAGLPVVQRIPAGADVTALPPGGAARIFTGAPLPQGADCVVAQEQAWLDEKERLHLDAELAKGANIRRRGEEIRRGEPLLPAGKVLTPAVTALLAAQGIAQVCVTRRLKVALFSTGDELIEPGEPCRPGQVYNSNAAMLQALLAEQHCEVVAREKLVDNPDAVDDAFARAREQADLVVCSGGVSVGEEDHVRGAIERQGGIVFHGVAMKPGKPFAFGWLGESLERGTALIGLPGNPVGALVGWQLLALPFVHGCQGRIPDELMHFSVESGFETKANKARRELLRVRLDWSQGKPVAYPTGGQGSHMLGAAAAADGYLLMEVEEPIKKGHGYEYIPLSQFSS